MSDGHNVEVKARRELVRFSRWLYRLGYMPGTSGNLSVRLNEERILATPTGCSKFLLQAADMIVADMDGRRIAGTRNVTSEIGVHLTIYRERSDVQAVVHSHPPIATGFACTGRALDEALCSEAIMTLGPVPLAPYATTGTPELSSSLASFVSDHTAILLANHGAVTYGEDLLDAFMKMETLEHFAHICLVAHQLGSACPLQEDVIDDLNLARTRYQANATMLNGKPLQSEQHESLSNR
jgi:L-fuculose-phosphate aldolase